MKSEVDAQTGKVLENKKEGSHPRLNTRTNTAEEEPGASPLGPSGFEVLCAPPANGAAYWSPDWQGFSASVGWFEDDEMGRRSSLQKGVG